MLGKLKKLSGMENDTYAKGYNIMRYWHPDAKKRPEFVKKVATLEEAQDHCQDPSTAKKDGPTTEQYFDGYVDAGSKSSHITLW